MNAKKLALTVAVTATLGGVGAANAAITGLPGEAALAPLVIGFPQANLGTTSPVLGMETYIELVVPVTIGSDTVINRYTAPHTSTVDTTTVQSVDPAEIHWTLFDPRSRKVENGVCEVSPGDLTIWTTDLAYRNAQLLQRAGLDNIGIQDRPDPVCGPSTNTLVAGYVVFQTIGGADGEDADFAFWGQGTILDNAVVSFGRSVVATPVLPMADGADPLPSGSGTTTIFNSVIAGGTYGDGQPSDPVSTSPILAGIRMNNGDGVNLSDVVRIQAPIQGPLSDGVSLNGIAGQSVHGFWFDSNRANRLADVVIWDDHEGNCSDQVPLRNELNLLVYNRNPNGVVVLEEDSGGVDGSGKGAEQLFTDLIAQWGAQPPATGKPPVEPTDMVNGFYCIPDYWQPLGLYPGSLAGYVDYSLDEEGNPLTQEIGLVNSAAVAWNWQEALRFPFFPLWAEGWSFNFSTDIGKHY